MLYKINNETNLNDVKEKAKHIVNGPIIKNIKSQEIFKCQPKKNIIYKDLWKLRPSIYELTLYRIKNETNLNYVKGSS